MNGACQTPRSSRRCGRVGGACSRPGNCASIGCGATHGATAAAVAPWVAPHPIEAQFPGLLHAPPTRPHLRDDRGVWHAPFIYRWRLANQLEQRYEEDRSTRIGLAWFARGTLV